MIKIELLDGYYIRPLDTRNWIITKALISKKGRKYEKEARHGGSLESILKTAIDDGLLENAIDLDKENFLQYLERLSKLFVELDAKGILKDAPTDVVVDFNE